MKLTLEQRLEMACLQLEFYGHSANCIDPENGSVTNLRTGELIPLQANAVGRPELQEWALTFSPIPHEREVHPDEIPPRSAMDTEPD